MSSWNLVKIRADRRKIAETAFKDASREQIIDRLVEVEASLYTMTYSLSELDIAPGPRCNAWMTSNMFPCMDDADKVLTIEKDEPRVEYRETPPTEKWHETEFSSADSLSIKDGSKIHDDFKILAVHQNAVAAYIGCGNISMGDVRHAARLLWAPQPAPDVGPSPDPK